MFGWSRLLVFSTKTNGNHVASTTNSNGLWFVYGAAHYKHETNNIRLIGRKYTCINAPYVWNRFTALYCLVTAQIQLRKCQKLQIWFENVIMKFAIEKWHNQIAFIFSGLPLEFSFVNHTQRCYVPTDIDKRRIT